MRNKKQKKINLKNRASQNVPLTQTAEGRLNEKDIAIFLIFSSITIIFSFFAYYIINHVGFSPDEGFYIMAAKEAISGKIPYRDFGYTQTPILPYVNGFLLYIIGFGQQAQRVINMCWGYLAIIISMIFVLRLRGLLACFICGWVLLSSPYWVGQNYIGTYGLTNLLMTLTAIVFCSLLHYNLKVILFSIFGVLAISCRLTVAPAVIILWAFLVWEGTDQRQKLKAIITFIAVGLTILLPFFIASPDNFIFWNIGYHIICTIHRRIFYEHILASPSIFIMISLAVPLAFHLKKKLTSHEVALLLAAIAGIISQMIPKASYACYTMLFSTMGVIGGSIILSDFKWKKYIYAFLVIFPLIYLTPLNPFNYLPLPVNVFIDDNWNNTLNEAGNFLRANTHANDLLLTPFPVMAIESDREIFHGMEMGMFTITDTMDQTRARNLNLMHYDHLIDIVRNRKAKAIIIDSNQNSFYNFFVSMPHFEPVNPERINLLYYFLARNYQVVYEREPLKIIMPK